MAMLNHTAQAAANGYGPVVPHSNADIIQRFVSAMADAGMVVDEPIIADGVLHRVYVRGDKSGTKNGAYILHVDGKPAGFFEHFRTGIRQTWSLSGKREPLSPAMRQQIEAAKLERQREQQAAHELTARKAKFIWHKARLITLSSEHAYLVKKRIQPNGVKVYGDALVIPIFAADGDVVNLQFIDAEGNKRFLSGGRKKGCFAVIGPQDKAERILICEGFATGASLVEATGCLVFVAMDAGNLEPVAREIRRLVPDSELIIMGDNDESGKGQIEARKAALAVGAVYKIPSTPGHDWNDAINAGAA